jgi:uncharacterized RDD family membrane protein YckC
MHCKHCGFANGEDDHRCLRCGRRLAGIVISAPPGYSGANALAVMPSFDADETQDFLPLPVAGATQRDRPVQPGLFGGSDHKVIPFEQIQRRVAGRSAPSPVNMVTAPVAPAPSVATARPQAKKHSGPLAEQTSMDFFQSSAAQRTLKNNVPAQIFCEQAVATVQHRLVAAAIDGAVILLSFGVFAGIVEVTGAGFGDGKLFWMMLGVSFVFISLFYGLIWALTGRETAGMYLTDLQLITFDGNPVDAQSRAIRFASTWLSFCSGGLGLVWAVADEENLTWHDHISKTFPTFREVPRHIVRPRI